MAWLTQSELDALGFAAIGSHVLISNKASLHNCANIRLGSHVRIDDFCVLSAGSGGIDIGNYVHIAVYTALIGAGRITLDDFVNLSSRVSLYSSNDDYSGSSMTNPMVPAQFTNVEHAPVTLEKHVIVGSGSVILPGVTLHKGVAIGALSLVNKDCNAFTINVGTPAKSIGVRKQDLLEQEANLMASSRVQHE